MDQQASAAPASFVFGDEDWELCNDGGFIFNRMRCMGEETTAGGTSNPPDLEVNPAEEERNRKKRKREILVKLKRKYQREIDHWEILSNSLCAMQEKSNQFQSSLPETSSSMETRDQVEKDASIIDELLSMEEAREGIIQNVLNLCEIAEEMCRKEEEEKEEMLFNLPVWGTPRDLMSSLCYDEI